MDDLLGKTIHGYTFKEIIGFGSFATVFLVESKQFQTNFVAKVMKVITNIESTWKTFSRETDVLKQLDHPNIIRLYDFFREDSLFYQILEYCPNGSLEDEIKRNGFVSHERCKAILSQLFDGLKFMHDHNVCHHDIKPANILFDPFGRPKFADFGIAIKANESSKNYQCSIAYACPEIILKKPFDPKSADIWALGVTIIYMATGQLPWPNDSSESFLRAIISIKPVILEPLPSDLIKLINMMVCPVKFQATITEIINSHVIFGCFKKCSSAALIPKKDWPKTSKQITVPSIASFQCPQRFSVGNFRSPFRAPKIIKIKSVDSYPSKIPVPFSASQKEKPI